MQRSYAFNQPNDLLDSLGGSKAGAVPFSSGDITQYVIIFAISTIFFYCAYLALEKTFSGRLGLAILPGFYSRY
jgi:hypothetical protein